MKQILLAITLLALRALSPAYCQSVCLPLPPATLVLHYRLPVTYNSTTVIVFAAPVRPVDRGDRDVMAQRQPGVDNVLKLKAARRNFQPTNLHVFTADGRLYAFDLFYTDSLASTYNLTRLDSIAQVPGPQILLTMEPINTNTMARYVSEVRSQPPTFSKAYRRYQMQLRLEAIDMAGQLLFFRFRVTNRSNLDYAPDFIRLYICDEAKAKRTSRQDQEIAPVYADSLSTVPGKDSRTFILAIPRVTIPDKKEFLVELYEKDGGRALALRIRNRQLFHVRPLAASTLNNNGKR